jgi:hypothetical protein
VLTGRRRHSNGERCLAYLVEVPGPMRRGVGRQLLAGVELEDGPVRLGTLRLVDSVPGRVLVEVVLPEGRERTDAAADLLIGACFQQAFLRYFREEPDFPRSAAVNLVRALLPTLQP